MESNESIKTIFNCDFGFIGKAEFTKQDRKLNTKIYSIRLGRVFDQIKNKNNRLKFKLVKKIFKINRINDLTHAITGLYDTSLPDIGARPIYECVCHQKAFTICILDDNHDDNHDYNGVNDSSIKEELIEDKEENYSSDDCLSGVEDSMQDSAGIFNELYSENDSEEGESDEEEVDDLKSHTKGLKSFLKNNKINRSKIVKNLIACATLERVSTFQLPGQDEWIIDLQLMAVRQKYRGFSIGKYLINLIQNRNLVGNYDAIVTCSDTNAIQFYEKYAFSVDSILNSKYSHIGDIWTDATKMCFIPPYVNDAEKITIKGLIKDIESEQDIDYSLDKILAQVSIGDDANDEIDHTAFITELTNMERDFKRWQKLMFSSYQFQSKLFFKFKQEILSLKANLCAKNSLIDELKIKNDLLTKNNKLLQSRLTDMEINQSIKKN